MLNNLLTSGNYCVYLRKSRKDVELELLGEDETLARHEKMLLSLAKSLKISLKKIFREVVSGETIQERPEMQKVLKEVEDGLWDGVLVMEVERLARGDTSDQGIVAQTFKYSSTKIITPSKIYDPDNEFDEEYFEFGLFMSRREFKTINRRLQNGRLTSVSEGKYVGNIPPYGYRKVKLPKEKGYSLEIIPDEADVVKMIFDLYVNGEINEMGERNELGPSLIAKKLNYLNIPAIKGGRWSPSTINHLIRNPVYMGKIKWGSRPTKKKRVDGKLVKSRPRLSMGKYILVDGRHHAIINEELWHKASKKPNLNPSKPTPNKHRLSNPLAGLIKCANCGRTLIRRPLKKQEDVLMCQNMECNNVSSYLKLVEERIVETLKDWLIDYKTDWENNMHDKQENPDIVFFEKAIKKNEGEIENLKKQLDVTHDLLEQNVYSTEVFIERSKKLSDKISSLNAEKDVLSLRLQEIIGNDKDISKAIPIIEHFFDLYSIDKPATIRNELLKTVISKVVYKKEKRAHWSGSRNDFHIQIYPKLPRSPY